VAPEGAHPVPPQHCWPLKQYPWAQQVAPGGAQIELQQSWLDPQQLPPQGFEQLDDELLPAHHFAAFSAAL